MASSAEANQKKEVVRRRLRPEMTEGHDLAHEVWPRLVHASVEGNVLFPQAHIAQAFLVAEQMVSLVLAGKANWQELSFLEPDWSILQSLEQAKIHAHQAYHIDVPNSRSIPELWRRDQSEALELTANLLGWLYEFQTQSILDQYPKQKIPQAFEFLEESRILELQAVLKTTKSVLTAHATKVLAEAYRQKISEFMVKHFSNRRSITIELYKKDLAKLKSELREVITCLFAELKNACILAEDGEISSEFKARIEKKGFGSEMRVDEDLKKFNPLLKVP